MAEYIKIWLLEDFTTMIDYGTKGATHYWKLVKEYDNGDIVVERKHSGRALLWAKDVAKGERHTEPNLSLPLGMHLGIERGYKRNWYGKYVKNG